MMRTRRTLAKIDTNLTKYFKAEYPLAMQVIAISNNFLSDFPPHTLVSAMQRECGRPSDR